MNIAELKDQIASLSTQERLELAAFIADLDHEDDLTFREQVDHRMKAMDNGKKVSMEEFEREHLRLRFEGSGAENGYSAEN